MNYTPDRWAILKIITENNKPLFKVLAGWSGSYLEGANWKINSGITKIEEDENYYYLHGYSGSIYTCHKKTEGMNSITVGVWDVFKNHPDVSLSSIEELKEYL